MNILKSKLSLSRIKIPGAAGKEANLISFQEKEIEKKATQQKSECNLIFENIYLSGCNIASDLEFLSKNSFTHVINCAKSSRNFTAKNFENFIYLNLNIEDDPGYPILDAIRTFIDFIENTNALLPSRKILVHCFEGISRAPSLLAAYLIWKLQISKEAAIKIMKEKRSCVEINFGFLCQLEKWSKFCEDKNKLLNKKVKFSIKKSSFIKHDNSNDFSSYSLADDQRDNKDDSTFLHSKIRVVEQIIQHSKENFFGVIRIHNCNKENDDSENIYNNDNQEVEVNEEKKSLILNET